MSASPSRWSNVVVSSVPLPPPPPEAQPNRNNGDKISHKYELSDPSTLPEDERNRTIGSNIVVVVVVVVAAAAAADEVVE